MLPESKVVLIQLWPGVSLLFMVFFKEASAQRELGVDTNKAVTTLQVRMPDGRLLVKLNTTHTVGDLRRYIRFKTIPFGPVRFLIFK
jgi:hypothetical protein